MDGWWHVCCVVCPSVCHHTCTCLTRGHWLLPLAGAGLYVCDPDGSSVQVLIPEGAALFLLGDAMQCHTGGALRACPHLVLAAAADCAIAAAGGASQGCGEQGDVCAVPAAWAGRPVGQPVAGSGSEGCSIRRYSRPGLRHVWRHGAVQDPEQDPSRDLQHATAERHLLMTSATATIP